MIYLPRTVLMKTKILKPCAAWEVGTHYAESGSDHESH
jgi:hypothetical protein